MRISETFSFTSRVKINSGIGAAANLPFELASLGAGKPLVISDERSSTGQLINALRDSNMIVGVVEKMPSQPDLEWMRRVAGAYGENRCDALIAVGGSSMADTAKGINIMVSTRGQHPEAFAGTDRIANPLNPLVLVPTTPYCGAESARFARIGDIDFESHHLMPDLVIVDPDLLLLKRTEQTVEAALSALAYSVESFATAHRNPVSEMYASGAIRLIRHHLMQAANEGTNRTAHATLIHAAVMAGVAASNTKTIGMACRLGNITARTCRLPAGLCMGLLLPYALEYRMLKNAGPASDLLLPLAGPDAYAEAAENLRGPIAVNIVYALLYDLNKSTRGKIPLNLKEAGVDRHVLYGIAEKAADENEEEEGRNGRETILQHAWEGRPIISL